MVKIYFLSFLFFFNGYHSLFNFNQTYSAKNKNFKKNG